MTGLGTCIRVFAAQYSREAALRCNSRNACHKQTPSQYEQIVENDVKYHSLTHINKTLPLTIMGDNSGADQV